MSRFLFILVLLLALLLGSGALWLARREWTSYEHQGEWPGRSAASRHAGQPLTLEEILRRLQIPEGSRILEVEREHEGGGMHYEIELLMPDGRVLELHLDPWTAEILERETEDEEKELHY